ncbi:MAG TPA: ABC transporter substrate-binding protein [Candidatus Polarisedimenticolaceae bacterium]|nr:ABC transporter substrate-binding protein [Candidatus Polarisedimenticolaceae bacterium]
MQKTCRLRFGFSSSKNRKSKIQNRQWLGLFVIAFVLVVTEAVAEAQQNHKIIRIGILDANSEAVAAPRLEAFREGLRELGHLDGQNISIEPRYADGKLERIPALAAELVQRNIDIFVVSSTPGALAAKNATKSIPIVFFGVTDPVGAGLVPSLPRPAGNITGLTNIAAVLSGKRLELLKETIPKISRVAVLWDPKVLGSVPQWEQSQLPAKEFGIQLYSMRVSSGDKFDSAFKSAINAGSNALAVTLNPLANSNQKHVVGLSIQYRIPTIFPRADFVESGGLMSYGPMIATEGRDAARLVDKIMKGAKPADLPVEQPSKFELVINLNTAKQIGVTIPPNVLARADRVIK